MVEIKGSVPLPGPGAGRGCPEQRERWEARQKEKEEDVGAQRVAFPEAGSPEVPPKLARGSAPPHAARQ